MPLPTMRAVGVARPRAQGQAMTSTATVAPIARATGPSPGLTQGSTEAAAITTRPSTVGKASHASSVRAATTSTAGTKTAVTRSANSCTGTRVPWACSTRRITWARKVSRPTRVAFTLSNPCWFTVAPITSSPTPRVTGTDSPVAIDSSTALVPSTTTPSVGIFSPGRTSRMSPTRTSPTATRTSCPSSSRVAVSGSSSRSLRMASDALPRARASKYLPVRWKAMIMAATPA